MSAPREAEETRITQAILTQLLRIKREGGKALWLTQPAAIEEAPLGVYPQNDLPGIYLWLADWQDQEMLGPGIHEAKATFHAVMCSANNANGAREQQRLCRDVRKALAEGEGAIEHSLVIQGQPAEIGDRSVILAPVGYTYQAEISQRLGLAVGSYVFTVTYVWRHDVPELALSAGEAVTQLHPFEFPLPTTADDLILAPSPTIKLGLTNGARQIVFSTPVGTSGIIRNISFVTGAVLGGTSTPAIPGATIEIKYDGSSTPQISIPLLTLIGMENARSSLQDLFVSSPAFEIMAGIFRSAFPGTKFGPAGNFRLPIPYGNGIEISVVAPLNTDEQAIFFNIVHQNRLPTSWNNNLRLRADRSNETIVAALTGLPTFKITDATHIISNGPSFPSNIAGRCIVADTICTSDMLVLERTDATHLVISAKDTVNALLNVNSDVGAFHGAQHTFLNRPAGEAGYLAMIVGGMKNTIGDVDILFEANPRIFLDQHAEQDLEWTSVEDFANGAYYFEQPNHGEEGGVTAHDPSVNGESCIYKVFMKWPIRYRNGVKASVPQYSTAGSSSYNWTTFYYKEN